MYEHPTTPLPPRRGRPALIVLAVFAAVCCAGAGVGVIGWVARSGGGAGTGTPDQGARAAVGSAATTGPGLGDPVRDGKFEFTVESASCGHRAIQNGWLHAEPQGQFCLVELRVTNIATEPQRFADGVQQAIGPDGTVYAADTGAGVVANGNGVAVWNVVNPGNGVSATVVFDIPPKATLATVRLHDSGFSRGVTVRLA